MTSGLTSLLTDAVFFCISTVTMNLLLTGCVYTSLWGAGLDQLWVDPASWAGGLSPYLCRYAKEAHVLLLTRS